MQNPWKARSAIIIAMMVFGVAIFVSTRGQLLDWMRVASYVGIVSQSLTLTAIPFFLLAASFAVWTQFRGLAIVLCFFGLIFGIGSAITGSMQSVIFHAQAPIFFRAIGSSMLALGVLSVLLLLIHRLRSGLEIFRIVAVFMLVFLIAIHEGALYTTLFPRAAWFITTRAIYAACTFLYLAFISWCIAFRSQILPNRPPADSSRTISLTCPRCATPQSIPSGHGQCSNCRLQISISLQDGTCRTCNYSLRGLTSEKCPECGTPIVPPPANTELLSWAQANDQQK